MKKFSVLFFAVAVMFAFTGVANAGSISGKVTYKGKAGAPKKIKVTKDQNVCGAKGALMTEEFVISGGGLANVVLQAGEGDVEPKQATITQDNCKYGPHVSLINAGSKVVINNKDGILHNFHSFPDENEALNFAQPGSQKAKTLSEDAFEVGEIFPIKCDVHEWMTGYIAVVETPYAAVSGNGGAYKISNIPDGSYTLQAWHEKAGGKEIEITVKGDTKLDIAL